MASEKSVIIIKPSRLLSRLRLPSERVDREIGARSTRPLIRSRARISGSLAPRAEHDRHDATAGSIVRSAGPIATVYRSRSRLGRRRQLCIRYRHAGLATVYDDARATAWSCNYPVFHARTSAPGSFLPGFGMPPKIRSVVLAMTTTTTTTIHPTGVRNIPLATGHASLVSAVSPRSTAQ